MLTLRLVEQNVLYIITDEDFQLLETITQLKNGRFAKCRRSPTSDTLDLSFSPNEKYDYQCGHWNFLHETIILSAAMDPSIIDQNHASPILYKGPSYSKEISYSIVPIAPRILSDQLNRIVSDPTYYVALDYKGHAIDVVAKLINNDFIRCSRIKRTPNANYLCGNNFFSRKYLNDSLAAAKQRKHDYTVPYPKAYKSWPFFEISLIFPIYPNAEIYSKESPVPRHFLVMNNKFQLVATAEISGEDNSLQPCQKL
ncbi:hypothetical protein HI914_03672 [Erysiphe necator]|nr:hypothetical protein HI914_03672 [Erysiphe necator]